jgi:hypothetical protein
MIDLAVALFVAILVLAALYVPRWGDAIGRRLRRGGPALPPEDPQDRDDED